MYATVRKTLAGFGVAGVLGFAALGFGAGEAQARDWCWWGWCDVPPPGHVGHVTGIPPGHLGHITGIPPGHWDKPWKWFR